MQNLADTVLDYYFYLYFAQDEAPDAERSIKLLELFNQIECKFSDEEKQALKDAARRRMQREEEFIENGGVPPYDLTKEHSFLHNMAYGYFDLEGLDSIQDPDEDFSNCDE